LSRLSKTDILVLSSLARVPMHGYEIKLDLRFNHVRWWARCDHGHVYTSLTRLEKKGLIEEVPGESGPRGRRVFQINGEGRAWLLKALEQLGTADDATYFDIDLFVAGSFLMDQAQVVDLLEQRAAALRQQLEHALDLERSVTPHIPEAGRLIIGHRVHHLEHEIAFAEQAAARLGALDRWGPLLEGRSIEDSLEAKGVAIEG